MSAALTARAHPRWSSEPSGQAWLVVSRVGSDQFGRLNFPHTLCAYSVDEPIYGDGDAASHVYVIVSGTVRTCKFLMDGRRQVEAFHGPHDVFGIEAGARHLFSAEAVSDCLIAQYHRHKLASVAGQDVKLSELLFAVAARSMMRAQEHALLLGCKSALDRVGTFLISWAARSPDDRVAELTMTRQDIADYLGLTIETVSRTLSVLEQRQLIEMQSPRRIRLTGLDASLPLLV
jgi:CRP/FNR family nitrogen fixation transcriptional regulator